MLDRAFDHLVDLLGLAHVELYRERVDARLAQRVPPAFEMIGIAAGDGDARAERSEAARDRQADARTAAGDDGDLVLQQGWIEHDPRLSMLRLHDVEHAPALRDDPAGARARWLRSVAGAAAGAGAAACTRAAACHAAAGDRAAARARAGTGVSAGRIRPAG